MKSNNKSMRKNVGLFFLCVVLGFTAQIACTSHSGSQTVAIRYEKITPIDPLKYKRIFLAGFIQESQNSFNAAREAFKFLQKELQYRAPFLILYENPLLLTTDSAKSKDGKLNLTSENILKNPLTWKTIAEKYGADLVITGTLSMTEKEIKDIEKQTRYRDGKPYQISKLVERKEFILSLRVFFFDGQTGEQVYTQKFQNIQKNSIASKESKTILAALIKEMLPDIRAIMVKRVQPAERILLQ